MKVYDITIKITIEEKTSVVAKTKEEAKAIAYKDAKSKNLKNKVRVTVNPYQYSLPKKYMSTKKEEE